MRKKRFWLMAAALFLSVLAAACIGRYPLTPTDIWNICTGTASDALKRNVLLEIRLPRILFAAMTGAALSVSGMVYQELFSNPLVSPDVLGVSGGACVGAVAAILLGLGSAGTRILALGAGLMAVLFSAVLSGLMGRGNRMHLLLSGIVVKALADAVIMALKYMADPERQLASIDYWLMGSFHTVRWENFGHVIPAAAACFLFLWAMRFRIQVLSLGDEEAESLGVSVLWMKRGCILAATVLVAATVSVTGIVTWVGLLIPHMARIFTGENGAKDFGFVACLGAAFLIWADTLARSLTEAEIPISILTSAAGAVFLFAVLLRRKRRGEADG